MQISLSLEIEKVDQFSSLLMRKSIRKMDTTYAKITLIETWLKSIWSFQEVLYQLLTVNLTKLQGNSCLREIKKKSLNLLSQLNGVLVLVLTQEIMSITSRFQEEDNIVEDTVHLWDWNRMNTWDLIPTLVLTSSIGNGLP